MARPRFLSAGGESEYAGSLLLTFRLSELTEFKRWLRGFGGAAEIVRPDWLRREFVEELTAALRRYDD